ncbi:MAG: ROK family protein [Micrococcaceae bacterium]
MSSKDKNQQETNQKLVVKEDEAPIATAPVGQPKPNTSYIGIDIGGTGIKGGLVDVKAGKLIGKRYRIDTPKPATPESVGDVVKQIVDHFLQDASGEAVIGATFPAIIKHGVAKSAANVDKSWIDANVAQVLSEHTGHKVHVVNDADAAGVAEYYFGAGSKAYQRGVQMTITLGTGIGSAVMLDGILLPNTELGHLELDGHDAETRASAVVREKDELSFKKYAKKRLTPYFQHVEMLFSPDCFIVGGGISKRADDWLPYLQENVKTPILIASLANNAGIVGAAALAKVYFDKAENKEDKF